MIRHGPTQRYFLHICTATALVFAMRPAPSVGQRGPDAGRAQVQGRVLGAEGRAPLEGVSVTLDSESSGIVTDERGRYRFSGLRPGSYTLVFELIGRASVERTVSVGSDESVSLDVTLPTRAVLLDQIQVTATRSRRAVSEVPAVVSVVEREEIERAQAAKIGDLFAAEPGVEVSGVGPFEGLPVIRGLSGNRVLVLVDGQRLNNAREAINFGGVQPSLVDVEQIEEVEILRGPASVLYGSDALGGIVNIVTRRPPFPQSGLAVRGSVASTYRTVNEGRAFSGDVRVTGSRVGLRLGGTWRDAGNFDSPEGEVVNSSAETLDVGADVDIRVADGQHVRLEAQRFRADDVGIAGTSGTFTGSFPFTDRDKVSIAYSADDLSGLGSLRVHGYVQDQEESFRTLLDLPPIPAGPFELLIDSESERVSDVETLGVGFQVDTRLHERHRLTYGVDFFRDDVDERRLETTLTVREPTSPGPPASSETSIDSIPTTPESSFSGIGLYLQDEIEAGRWSLTPGVRFDRFDIDTRELVRPEGVLPAEDRTEQALSASLGVLVRATEHVRPTLSVGRAFRTPNIIERFFFGPGSQGGLSVPNPELDNETSVNVDVGLKLVYPTVRGSVTYFHNRVNDFITFQPGTFAGDSTFAGQPISQVQNVGSVRIRGIEASAEHVFVLGGERLAMSGALAWTDGRDLEEGRPLFVPPVKGVIGLGWSEAGGLASLSLSARAVGSQTDLPEGFEETEGFVVVDVRGSLDLRAVTGHDLVLRVGLANLTDRAYREPLNNTLSPGRSLETSVRVRF